MEETSSIKLLDIATQINVLQKVYYDFCTCVFAEIGECDAKYDRDEDSDDVISTVEDIDKRILIRQTMMSLSKRYRFKLKELAETWTGTELEIMDVDTIYDEVMANNMSKIVDDIVAKVRERHQKEAFES